MLRITDPANGWPALGDVLVEGEWVAIAIFVGPVTLSQRERDAVERRFQNPGQNRPIVIPAGRLPLLLGLWERDDYLPVPRPLLALVDAIRREGNLTRYSVFLAVRDLIDATATGWVTGVSETGEQIRYFLPQLLPAVVAASVLDSALIDDEMRDAVAVSGLMDNAAAVGPETRDPAERLRRQAMALVRDARFSRDVKAAYDGRCAMCGLGAPLVQGAHIYPVAAEGSVDHPSNGIALCANHHLAFDNHLVAVHPPTNEIVFHPEVVGDDATPIRPLISSTFDHLVVPRDPAAVPLADMFVRRYRHFAQHYASWLLIAPLADKAVHAPGETGPMCGKALSTVHDEIAATARNLVTCPECCEILEWNVIDELDAVSVIDAEEAKGTANLIMLGYSPQPISQPVQWAYDSLKERSGWQ